MPVNTTRVIGEIRLPQDVVPERSVVHFKITGFDTDLDDNVVIAPRRPQTAQIQNDGTIDINLWPNDDGTRSTLYNVELEIYNGNSPYIVPLGKIEVPQTAGPHDLTDLLPVQPPANTPLEEYLAYLQAAVSSAESAADRAETAAASVAESEWQNDGSLVAKPVLKINARSGITATQDGTDPELVHLDVAGGTGGGIARYTSLSSLRADIANDVLVDGSSFLLHNHPFTVDRSLDDDPKSFLYNTSGFANLGVKSDYGAALNYYLFSTFDTQSNTKISFDISPDGRRFSRLNKYPIMRGTSDSTVGGRDTQMFWNPDAAEWHQPVTAGTGSEYDLSTFVYADGAFTPGFKTHQITGTNAFGGIRGTNVPGGTIPVERQWGNRFQFIGGQLYLFYSLQVHPDYIAPIDGNPSPTFRPYYSVVTNYDDINTITFSAPTPMNIGGSTDPKIDGDFMEVDGVIYCCIKNSSARNIEVWSAATLDAVSWTLESTIDIDGSPTTYNSLEGPTWAPHRYVDPSDPNNVLVKWRVHFANNRSADDNLIGIPSFAESTTSPAGPYGSVERLTFEYAARNGTITNVPLTNDPRAESTLQSAAIIFGGEKSSQVEETIRLETGAVDLIPRPNFLYYVNTADYEATVTITEKVAERFWLACLSSNAGTKINVVNNVNCVGGNTIGGGAFSVVEYRWVDVLSKYVAMTDYASGGGSLSFSNDGTPVDGGSVTTTLDVISDGPAEVTGTGTTKQLIVRGPDWETTAGEYLMKDSAGTNRWGFNTDGTFRPINGAYDIGTYTNPWAGYLFNGQSVDGLNDGNNTYRQIVTNSGITKMQKSTTTGHNDGNDVSSRATILNLGGSFSGTHTFDPDEGSYIFATLGGAATFNLSAIREGEVLNMTIRALNSQTIAFTLPGGKTMRWVGGTDYGGSGGATIAAGTFWTNTDFSVLSIPGAIHIVAAEAVNAS